MIKLIKSKLKTFFPALKHRNFRLFFIGQGISLIGTWLQQATQQWLVYAIMTNSKIALGILSAAHGLPIFFFTLFAGVVADKSDKRKILIYCQTTMMILAFILAFLVYLKLIQFWQVILLGFLLGVANAFDWPTRQSFWPEIVPEKKDITSAVSLYSAIFQVARTLGPAIAAFLIGTIGIAACFFLNGVSFLGVIFALLVIKTKPLMNRTLDKSIIKNIRQGFSYLKHHREPLLLILLMSVVGIFIWSFTTLLPVFAKDIFFGDEKVFGILGVALGMGAIVGASTLFYLSEKIGKSRLLFLTALVLITSLFIFSFNKILILSLFLLFLIGFSFAAFNALDNSLIQEIIPDEVRGRIMSIYVLLWGGTMPFGSLYISFLAHYFGVSFSIIFGLIISLIFLLVVFYWFKLGKRLEVLLATTK